MTELTNEQLIRFWGKIKKTPNVDDCWLWTAGKSKSGYGAFKLQGKTCKSHRVSYFLHYGELSEELLVCHKCDVKACCNPHHLFQGTSADNAVDRENKNRSNPRKGDLHHASKFTDAQITEIRNLYAQGEISQYKLAKVYKVTQSVIGDIVRKITWKHVG